MLQVRLLKQEPAGTSVLVMPPPPVFRPPVVHPLVSTQRLTQMQWLPNPAMPPAQAAMQFGARRATTTWGVRRRPTSA